MGEGPVNSYRAMASNGSLGDQYVHLVREGAEASLCGLPRAGLGPAGTVEHACPTCIAWLPRRMAASGVYGAIGPSPRPTKPGTR